MASGDHSSDSFKLVLVIGRKPWTVISSFASPPSLDQITQGDQTKEKGGWKASLHICHGELIRIQNKTKILNADLALIIEINIRKIAHIRRIIGVIECFNC
jgi:hypothetical protein